jgi:hypothetical protein
VLNIFLVLRLFLRTSLYSSKVLSIVGVQNKGFLEVTLFMGVTFSNSLSQSADSHSHRRKCSTVAAMPQSLLISSTVRTSSVPAYQCIACTRVVFRVQVQVQVKGQVPRGR